MDYYTDSYAFTLLEALLPRVHIQPELPGLLVLAEAENESFSEKRMVFLGSLAYHLPPNELKKFLSFAGELRQAKKGAKLAGYKILHAAATQLQRDEIREVLPEIQTFLKTEYEKFNVLNSKKVEHFQVQIVTKLFSTLSQFLPQLTQDEIISVLPPIEALWNNQADDARAIALANFLEKVIPIMKYETISEDLFLKNPLLFLMKIMHQCKEKTAVKPDDSISYSNFGQSLFSQPKLLQNNSLTNTALEQEPENSSGNFNR